MKTYFKTIATIFLLIFIISCKEKVEKKLKPSKIEQATKSEEIKSTELRLDEGKKWIANAETTTGVHNMIKLMNNFSDKENISAYAILKSSLEKEFNLIFKNCTMKGEAHNQLHNFLFPIKKMFGKLSSSELKTCQTTYNELNKQLELYQDFFE